MTNFQGTDDELPDLLEGYVLEDEMWTASDTDLVADLAAWRDAAVHAALEQAHATMAAETAEADSAVADAPRCVHAQSDATDAPLAHCGGQGLVAAIGVDEDAVVTCPRCRALLGLAPR